VDLVLLDNKHMDPGEHKRITGVDNRLILENTIRIRELGIPVIIRVPLIPGYNDSEENIRSLGRFMKELRLARVDLRPYHRLGTGKYAALGMRYTLEKTPSPCREDLARVVKSLESFGLEVSVV
jgi:pyruvate formate lyase activating enzyme